MPLFKRKYKRAPDGELLLDASGLNAVVDYIEVKRSTARWHPSPSWIERGVAGGFLSLGDGNITIKTGPDDDDLVYKIERAPGHYCCECKVSLDGEKASRQHVLSEHAGVDPRKVDVWNDDIELRKIYWPLLESAEFEASDAANPSGYCKINHYDCVRLS